MNGVLVVLEWAKSVRPAGLVAGLSLVSVGLLSVLVARWRLLQEVLGELESFRVKVRCFEGRCALLLPCADEYTSELGSDLRKVRGEIRAILGAARLRLFKLEQLLAQEDAAAVRKAARLLRAPLVRRPTHDESLTTARTSHIEWEARLEALLQDVGSAISDASTVAHMNGRPLRRLRRSTMTCLAAADIRVMSADTLDAGAAGELPRKETSGGQPQFWLGPPRNTGRK